MFLEYNKLRKVVSGKGDKGSVQVIFYEKDGDKIKPIIEDKKAENFLLSKNTKGFSGEIFEENKTIYCCVGSYKDITNKDVFVSSKCSGALFKYVETYFENYEIKFVDFKGIESIYFCFILASYKYTHLHKKPEENKEFNLVIPEEHKKICEIAHSQNLARFFGDTPANLMTPSHFVKYAEEIFKDTKVEMKVLEENECKELGMNLFLSVGQGSAQPSKLLTLKYFGDDSTDNHKIAMVGKGVTFDSGGISLKPGLNMHHMKYDMMGAGTLLMVFKTCVDLDLKINMTCTLPLVENMPSSTATKPGDVFTAMNGLSVEIGNTDAEGRLILADALCYAQKEYGKKPEIVIDAATLTGAMCIALGNVYSGFFTNSDNLSEKINSASSTAKELLFRMPVCGYYKDQLKSNCADLNNIGGRMAGSCTAAAFLEAFIEENVEWAHFDIAGMMNDSCFKEIFGSYATGRPLAMFVQLIKDLAKN